MRSAAIFLLLLGACGESSPAMSARLEGATGGASGSAATSTEDGAATSIEVRPDSIEIDGAAGTTAPAVADSGADTNPALPPRQLQVTWTFKYCGDNAISVGVIDQTTNKGLAGPVSIEKPRGNVFVLQAVTFTCAMGDIVCWSSSDKSGMCAACSDGAMPVVGC